jgi:hypothetical protein
MTTMEFSVLCRVCHNPVDSFIQSSNFILTSTSAVQERESIALSCGCTVDFPDWQIDSVLGKCKIYDFAGTLYIEFDDDEMIMEDDL